MTKVNIVSQVPVSMAHVKEELVRIKERDQGLGVRAERTAEYLNQMTPETVKQVDKVIKAVHELQVPRLTDEHIVKMVDLHATSEEKIKIISQGWAVTISKENIKKIADVIAAGLL